MSEVAEILSAHLGGEWRTMPEYEGAYFSCDGRCARIVASNGKVRLLKGGIHGKGYLAIMLRGSKSLYIHRAVCTLFNGSPTKGRNQVRHLDGNPKNNCASNLAWGTPKENQADRFIHGTASIGEANPMAKLTSELVRQMRAERESTGRPYYKIAKDFGVSTMTAFRAITNRAWTYEN